MKNLAEEKAPCRRIGSRENGFEQQPLANGAASTGAGAGSVQVVELV